MNEMDFNTTLRLQLAQHKIARIVKNGIADFSKWAPISKYDDQAAYLCFLEELIKAGRKHRDACPVALLNPVMNEEYLNWIYEAYAPPRPAYLLPSWRSLSQTSRLATCHALLAMSGRGIFRVFTVRFREDVVDSAFSSSKAPCSYLHERIQYHLARRGNFHFWQCFERSDDGIVHSHGALWCDHLVDERAIGNALRNGAGEIGNPKARARQVSLSQGLSGKHMGWVTYSRKDPTISRAIFKGEPYSCSNQLRAAAQELYESTRQLLNQQR